MSFINFQDPVSLVQAIQHVRQYQTKPQPPTSEEREKWIQTLIEVLRQPKAEWMAVLAKASAVPESLVNAWEFIGLADLLDRDLQNARTAMEAFKSAGHQSFPRGLTVLISPALFPLRLSLERLVPALLAGNGCLLKLSSRNAEVLPVFTEILVAAGIPEQALAISASPHEALMPVLVAHPAVRAVSFVGRHKNAAEIARNINPLSCRFQAWSGGQTAWGILEEAAIEPAIAAFREMVTSWSPSFPVYPTKIFVLDSFYPMAKERLVATWPASRAEKSPLVASMIAEGARVLVDMSPTLVENLSNCSELQQQELHAPVVQLISVKYAHEIGKWLNNGYYGFMASLWGDAGKARKLAEKMEVGRILVNASPSPTSSFLFGVKETASGNPDRRPFGSFYSEVREVSSAN